MRAVLISTYELGRQPFGLASAAAWLENADVEVDCLDLAVQELDPEIVRGADVVGVYLPMHTATRIALAALPRIRELNATARLFAWGLYAPMCETELRVHDVEFIAGGESEERLTDFVVGSGSRAVAPQTYVDLGRLDFQVPSRQGLAPLADYAQICMPDGSQRVVGATEASRGCKHLCRHCPVVPVYGGIFRVVPVDVVLADVAQQIAAGAEHITFGDPDFFNGPRHAERVVEALHAAHPQVGYDVTIKIEHLLQHRDLLPLLRETGCTLITSAVEAIDATTLRILDKGHSRDDFVTAVDLCREARLDMQPTFLPFSPWTTLDNYARLLETLVDLDLVGHVAPIQLAIRLLIPTGSRLLELPEVAELIGAYDAASLGYTWAHEDPGVDALQREVEAIVHTDAQAGRGRGETFARVWAATERVRAGSSRLPDLPALPDRATIPYLTEPWYC